MSTLRKNGFVRFLDLKWPDINCDLHAHTNRTDGQASVRDVMRRAAERGLRRIAFTEHVRRDTTWFSEFAREVRSASEDYPDLEVLVGCEAKALDTQGTLDASQEILAECDIVLGSVHRFPDGSGGYTSFSTLSEQQMAESELELALGLLEAAPIDVLAHPGGMYFRKYRDFPSDMMRELLNSSLERGIAVEISASYVGDLAALLKIYTDVNPYVSIGSDAHRLEQLGNCRDNLKAQGIGDR
jgi:putative hydrolase